MLGSVADPGVYKWGGGGGGGGLTSGSAMLCGIRNSHIWPACWPGGMCPLLPKAEAFGISSSEISVLHQFLSVSGVYFLLTCSPSAFNYVYPSYTIALGGVIMTIITIKINLQTPNSCNLKLT